MRKSGINTRIREAMIDVGATPSDATRVSSGEPPQPCGRTEGWWDAMKVKVKAFFKFIRFNSERLGNFVADRVRDGSLDAAALRHFGADTLKQVFKSLKANDVAYGRGADAGVLPILNTRNAVGAPEAHVRVHLLASYVIFNAQNPAIRKAVAEADPLS